MVNASLSPIDHIVELLGEFIVRGDVHHQVGEDLSPKKPLFKRVYTTNEERYLAVLPKHNLLPRNLQLVYQDVIDLMIPNP